MKSIRPLDEGKATGRRGIVAVEFLAACGVALFLAAVTIYIEKFSFAAADEAWLAFALSGSFTGHPAAWAPYLSPALTRAIAGLYGMAPGVPWYVIFQVGTIVLSMMVVNNCIFNRVRRHLPDRALIPGALFCLLADLPLCWPLARLSLFHVAAVAGAAMLCLLLDRLDSRSFTGAGILAAVLFFISASCARIVGAGLVLCAAAIVLPHLKGRGASKNPGILRRGICLLAALVVLLGGTVALSRGANRRLSDEYAHWTAVRQAYIDGMPGSYEGNEAAYDRAGWSPALAELTGKHFFMDKSFGTKGVSKVLGSDDFGASGAWTDLVRAAGSQIDANASRGMALGMAVLLHAVLLICIMLSAGRGGKRRELGLSVCSVLLADLLFLVIARKGSLNYVGAFTVGAPCLAVATLCMTDIACGWIRDAMALDMSAEDAAMRLGEKLLFAAVSLVVLAGGLGLYVLNGRAVCASSMVNDPEAVSLREDGETGPELVQYLADHRADLFVCDEIVLDNINVVQAMKPGALSNLYCWSQSQRYSPAFEEQQSLNGLTKALKAKDLRMDNVFFVSGSMDDIELLHSFLSETYRLETCAVAEELAEGAWVAMYCRNYDIDAVYDAKEAPLSLTTCSRNGEVKEYVRAFTDKKGKSHIQWVGRDEFLINYHADPDSEACEQTTRIRYGESTPTLTSTELGLFREGYRFKGWTVYSCDKQSWLVKHEAHVSTWEKEPLEADDVLYQYPNGAKLRKLSDPGTVIHFYGVWKETNINTAVYHVVNADGEEKEKIVSVAPGKSNLKLEDYNDMVGFRKGLRFAGWRMYRSDTQRWRVATAEGKQGWSKKVPKGNYWLYQSGDVIRETFPVGTELHFYAQMEDTDGYTIFYHSDSDTQSPLTTQAERGINTRTLSCQDLGFYRERQRFVGWKVYRSDTQKWLILDRWTNKGTWVKSPREEDCVLWRDGVGVKQNVAAGAELHLYAVWEDTDAFTVYYHQGEDEKASATTTLVPYGVPTATLTPEELGFFTEGKRFAGWRMFRGDQRRWGVVDADGVSAWAEKVPEGGSYWLYQAGWAVSKAVPAGTDLHFYAQWEDTDEYSVSYHETSKAKVVKTEVVRAADPGTTLTIGELGYDADSRRFVGWRVFREDTKRWWVADAEGQTSWAKTPPEGGHYSLGEDGFTLKDIAEVGVPIHLYAQWEDTFTVYYHMDEDSPASEIKTQIKYGVNAPLELCDALGFSRAGMTFAGWNAYRPDIDSWLVESDAEGTDWAKQAQGDWRLCLIADGATISYVVDPGAVVHLYAQWE